jgi:hypothetical protein
VAAAGVRPSTGSIVEVARLEADLANLRRATRWLIAHGEEDRLWSCLRCLWQLDRHGNRFGEALGLLEEALGRSDLTAEHTATLHRWAATAAFQLGRMERSLAELEAAMSVLGHPLPQRTTALVAALLRAAIRQGGHRLLPRWAARRRGGGGEAERIAMLSMMGNTLYFLQRPLPMLLYGLFEANAADAAADDPGAAACGYAEFGHLLTSCRLHRLGERYGARADACAARAQPSELVGVGHEARAMSHLALGRWSQAETELASEERMLTLAGAEHRRLFRQTVSGVSALYQGGFADALQTFTDALEAARAVGDDLVFVWAANGVTDAALGLGGDLTRVRSIQEEAVERSRHHAAPEQLKSVAVLAALRFAEDDLAEVPVLARAGSSLADEVRFFPVWAREAYSHLAQFWLALWDRADEPDPETVAGARQGCRQLRRFARAYPVGAARSLWAAGWLARLEGHPRKARATWKRSLETAERTGLPYDQARAHVALADISDEVVGADHRARARAILAELGIRPALLSLQPSASQLTLD